MGRRNADLRRCVASLRSFLGPRSQALDSLGGICPWGINQMIIRLCLAVSALVLLACSDGRVAIRGDDGSTEVRYSCAGSTSQLINGTNMRVVLEYVLRMARDYSERRDTSALRQIMTFYDQQDMPALERLVIRQICTEGVLAPPPIEFPQPGAKVPHLALQRLDGLGSVDLAELHGRIVVVDFWATWCKPCVQQMPALVTLATEHADRVTVIGIVHVDSPGNVAEWLEANPPGKIVHLLDPEKKAAADFRIFGVPSTYILDVDGRVLTSPTSRHRRMQLDELGPYLERTSRQAQPKDRTDAA